MRVTPTSLPDVKLVEPATRSDHRGRFFELCRADDFREAGLPDRFVQDNVSVSHHGVVRGLHLQHPRGQGKLVCVLAGEIFDVAVDVRVGSPTFGKWVGKTLSADAPRQLYIPPGFAHGFAVLSHEAMVLYKCTDYYSPADELTIRWDDPAIGIEWPAMDAVLSERDASSPRLGDMRVELLPRYDTAREATDRSS